MLVLSRQRDETIMIGDDIEITIVDIRGDKVRLGITAPATIPVHRKEVYEAIQRENREAAKVKMEDFSNLPKAPGKPGNVPPGVRPPGNRPASQPPSAPPSPPPGSGPENRQGPSVPNGVSPKNPPAGSEPGSSTPQA
jgi:carbon storage regulator